MLHPAGHITPQVSPGFCRAFRTIGCISLVLLFPFSLFAQEDPVDGYLKKQLADLHIPGASLAVVQNGKLLKSGSYGMSDLALRVPASAATVYEIGLMTKQFTAMGILMLAEEGRIGLEDPVTRFFPAAPPAWRPITVRHLLTHTSGIQNHVAVPGFLDTFRLNLSGAGFPDQKGVLDLFFQLPLEFAPGQSWSYDNTGYYLLGLVIEQVSGRSYWDFLQARIFWPLGMRPFILKSW